MENLQGKFVWYGKTQWLVVDDQGEKLKISQLRISFQPTPPTVKTVKRSAVRV